MLIKIFILAKFCSFYSCNFLFIKELKKKKRVSTKICESYKHQTWQIYLLTDDPDITESEFVFPVKKIQNPKPLFYF